MALKSLSGIRIMVIYGSSSVGVAVGAEVSPGGFTLIKSDFILRKCLSIVLTRQLNFSVPNRTAH